MKNLIKRSSFLLILLLSVAFVQVAEAQKATEYEYATLTIYVNTYTVAYPDGNSENGKIAVSGKNLEENAKTKNQIFNMLAGKNYELVSSVGGGAGTNSTTDYIFRRPKESQ